MITCIWPIWDRMKEEDRREKGEAGQEGVGIKKAAWVHMKIEVRNCISQKKL